MKKLFSVSLWDHVIASTLGCVAISLPLFLSACDDSGSSASNSVPEYKAKADLPDTCELEVAKVDTAYYACFENKWVEVTDSATIEQLKEGLDEDEIKAKLEELQSLLAKPNDNTPKPISSSAAQGKVENSDNEGDSSSSSEEDEPSSSSKKKDKDKNDSGSGEGGSGTGESGELARDAHFGLLDEFVDWISGSKAVMKKTAVLTDVKAALKSDKFDGTLLDNEQLAANYNVLLLLQISKDYGIKKDDYVALKAVKMPKDSTVLVVTLRAEASDVVAYVEALPIGPCGSNSYFKDTQSCEADVIKVKCGKETFDVEASNPKICVEGVIKGVCDNYELYDPETQYCKDGTTPTDLPECGGVTYNPAKQLCDTRGTGTIYKHITLGDYTWMAENLNYETESGSYCKESSKADCGTYGRFYNWATAVGRESSCNGIRCNLGSDYVQGICPDGWHIPDDEEMNSLKNFKLSVLFDPDGFNVQKAGFYQPGNDVSQNYQGLESYAVLWSTEQAGSAKSPSAYRLKIEDDGTPEFTENLKMWGNSVRCVKNAE